MPKLSQVAELSMAKLTLMVATGDSGGLPGHKIYWLSCDSSFQSEIQPTSRWFTQFVGLVESALNLCCWKSSGEVSHILNVNIFAYDYTGYGMSTGEPSEEALYADIEAAFKYLRDIVGIPWRSLAQLQFRLTVRIIYPPEIWHRYKK